MITDRHHLIMYIMYQVYIFPIAILLVVFLTLNKVWH